MLVAGEASGDRVAAELVAALRVHLAVPSESNGDLQPLNKQTAPQFFGAGGPAMADAGVEIVEDMMSHAVTGVTDVIRRLGNFVRLFHSLKSLAIHRQPDVLICVDFFGFNSQLASAVRKSAAKQRGSFLNWNPKIVQLVSPQVWGSRPERVWKLASIVDLLMTTIWVHYCRCAVVRAANGPF